MQSNLLLFREALSFTTQSCKVILCVLRNVSLIEIGLSSYYSFFILLKIQMDKKQS